MREPLLRISDGNSKLGSIPQVNLTPVRSCPKGVPCAKAGQCYAMKAYRQYPGTRQAWDANLKLALAAPSVFFQDLDAYLTHKRPSYFRFHSAGDCPSYKYLVKAIQLAKRHPNIRFLMFTKRHAWANQYVATHGPVPSNVALVLSTWPNMPLQNPYDLPITYVYDPKNLDERIPDAHPTPKAKGPDAYTCPGSCQTCKHCWTLQSGESVVFHKH